jgi:hypothetical protein
MKRPAVSALDHAALSKLQSYSAYDVSDALLKFKIPGGGVIADLLP